LPESDDKIEDALNRKFREVKKEWNAAKDSQDAYNREEMYSPRLDFAVGPFNIVGRTTQEKRMEIERTVAEFAPFIQNLKTRSVFPNSSLRPNSNPRCFLAIEIENTTSRKHRLGGIFNASMLGAYGIILAPDKDELDALRRLMNYVDYLEDVGKMGKAWRNAIIMTKKSFLEAS